MVQEAMCHLEGGWIALFGKVKGSFCGRIIWILIVVYALLRFVDNERDCGTLVRKI
jgi:hypothetical protein